MLLTVSILLGFLSLLFETSITVIPFSFVLVLLLFILEKKPWVFVFAFFLGLLVDIFAVHAVGITGLYFITFLFIVSLYDRKYEIRTLPFVIIASAIGSSIFLLLFGIFQSSIVLVSTGIAAGSFVASHIVTSLLAKKR